MAVSALKPEGQLLAIVFLNPWDPEDEIPEGGGPPFGVTKEELDSLFSPHFNLVEELEPKTAFPGREGREIVRLMRKKCVGVSAWGHRPRSRLGAVEATECAKPFEDEDD